MSATTRRTLLGVWAHPDDEAYLSAGLMLEHVERGDRVVIIMATLGEHGTDAPDRWPPRRLGAHRRRELRRSLTTLGVHEWHALGFEDGTCPDHDGTDAIAQHIADIRPDTIVTFGPDGMTGHLDHRAVSRWTTDAWQAAAPEAELLYTTVTDDFHRMWGHVNAQVGFWYDPREVPSTPRDELRHTVVLSRRRLDAKIAALRAHHSQTAKLERMIGTAAFRQWWSTETFRAAAAHVGAGADRRVLGSALNATVGIAA